MLTFNAIVLAGGKSSRLGGMPKAGLSNGSRTLLESTVLAVEQAEQIVVVGPQLFDLPAGVICTREEPVFSGPASAITAGLAKTPSDSAPWTAVFAVDMPRTGQVLGILLDAAETADQQTDGFAGITEGVFQPLAGIYRTEALRKAFDADTVNAGVRRFLHHMRVETVELPAGATEDIDTWESAEKLGFTQQTVAEAHWAD